MKGTPRSLWLSMANRATAWWAGSATAMIRQQQRRAAAEISKTLTGKASKSKSKPRSGAASRRPKR